MKPNASLTALLILSAAASAFADPIDVSKNVILCVNPKGNTLNRLPFMMYVKASSIGEYILFKNDGVKGVLTKNLSATRIELHFSAAGVGQRSDDPRLQETVRIDLLKASSERVQDMGGKVSDVFTKCKGFADSDDKAEMKAWIETLL